MFPYNTLKLSVQLIDIAVLNCFSRTPRTNSTASLRSTSSTSSASSTASSVRGPPAENGQAMAGAGEQAHALLLGTVKRQKCQHIGIRTKAFTLRGFHISLVFS